MRSKSLVLIALSVLGLVALQGCSTEPPKNGVPIQAGDYTHAPGSGAKPGGPGGGVANN